VTGSQIVRCLGFVSLPLQTSDSPPNKYRRSFFNQLPSMLSPTPPDTITGTRLPLMRSTAKRSVYERCTAEALYCGSIMDFPV
jgi:hypothetical protein